MINYKSNVDDYDLLYVGETLKALGVRETDHGEVIWLPKSQIDYEDGYYSRGMVIQVTIPDWLAEDVGIV